MSEKMILCAPSNRMSVDKSFARLRLIVDYAFTRAWREKDRFAMREHERAADVFEIICDPK
jgi:hypothetical protein